MSAMLSEQEARIRRERSARAVALALEGKWEEAISVNLEVLEIFPEDVEALNRLGKAYMELGRYDQARDAFGRALTCAPHNTIAKKNLERLAQLPDAIAPAATSRLVAPIVFIEEIGKSVVTVLHRPAQHHVLAKVAAGDRVALRPSEGRLLVETARREYLGEIEARLAARLLRLAKAGNRYSGAVVSVRNQEVSVTLREVYTHPNLVGVASFPTKGSGDNLAYLRLEMEAEVEEEDLAPEWTDPEDPTTEEMPHTERVMRGDDYEDEEETE